MNWHKSACIFILILLTIGCERLPRVREDISANGIAVNPQTHEILITDARDYVTPGKVYCFSPGGVLKWSTHTGDIPSRIVFTHKPLL